MLHNGVARTLKNLRIPKGDYWIKQWFSSIASLFKMGTSLKGKNLLPEAANSFPYGFTTLGDLPSMLLCLLRPCVTTLRELRQCYIHVSVHIVRSCKLKITLSLRQSIQSNGVFYLSPPPPFLATKPSATVSIRLSGDFWKA